MNVVCNGHKNKKQYPEVGKNHPRHRSSTDIQRIGKRLDEKVKQFLTRLDGVYCPDLDCVW